MESWYADHFVTEETNAKVSDNVCWLVKCHC